MDNQILPKKENRGGVRPNSGRKSKAEELALIEKLTPLMPLAFKALETGLTNGNVEFVKLYFAYAFGKPQEKVDLTTNGNELIPMSITLNLG